MSKAEKLAKLNADCALAWKESSDAYKFRMDTAAHLRALDASHQRLKEALGNCVAGYEADDIDDDGFGPAHEIHAARAALEQAKELE